MIPSTITIDEAKSLITFCKENGVKVICFDHFRAEFHVEQPKPMSLAPQDLAKVLADPMPPDSSMLFASAEDIEVPKE